MIVAITGTGTEIGKTHLACALVGALLDGGVRVGAWKPIESGVDGDVGSDEAALAAVAGVAGEPTLRLRDPLSPHLAARREGIAIDPAALRERVGTLAARWELVVVELAGGLFSPMDDRLDNADWLAGLGGAQIVLVAPDRLGVLHDLGATLRAARGLGLTCADVALVAPATPDAATGTNAAELQRREPTRGLAVHEIPRAPVTELRAHGAVTALARRIRSRGP